MSSVLVIGDSCKDVFVYCTCNRLAPEFPVQVLDERCQVENGGMAKNVQVNVTSLGVACDIVTNHDWKHNRKTRYIDSDTNYMFVRVDAENRPTRCNLVEEDIAWDAYDAVIVSDYDKGFLQPEDIEYICNNHNCVFIDTKKILGDWAVNASFIKINHQEYVASKHVIESRSDIADKVIRTMGSNGTFYRDLHFDVQSVDVKDVSGAGDTFLAGLVVEYIRTKDIGEAIKYGNKCATEVVQKRGVSTVSK